MSEEREQVCPCGHRCGSSSELRSHVEKEHRAVVDAIQVWGREIYPQPAGEAFIDADTMKCCGCDLCAEACSMHHFGIINKDLARIYVRNFLLPLPKAVVVTCCQCQDEERLCEKACPVTPAAIHFDKKTLACGHRSGRLHRMPGLPGSLRHRGDSRRPRPIRGPPGLRPVR